MGNSMWSAPIKLSQQGPLGIIEQGALVVEDGIPAAGYRKGALLRRTFPSLCRLWGTDHSPPWPTATAMLEYAAGSLYPVAEPAHLLAEALLLNALLRWRNRLGEQICGHRPAISRWGIPPGGGLLLTVRLPLRRHHPGHRRGCPFTPP